MTATVENLSVAFQDGVSANAQAAAQAMDRLSDSMERQATVAVVTDRATQTRGQTLDGVIRKVDGVAAAQTRAEAIERKYQAAVQVVTQGMQAQGATATAICDVIGRLTMIRDADLQKAEQYGRRIEQQFVNLGQSASQAVAQAAERAAAAQQQINAVLGVQNRSFEGTAKRGDDVAAYGAELDRLRAKYNPLFAAQQQSVAAQLEIERGFKTGALSATEASSALEKVTAGYSKVTAAAQQAAQAQRDGLANQGQAAANQFAGVQPTNLRQAAADRAAREADLNAAFEADAREAAKVRAELVPLAAAEQALAAQIDKVSAAERAGRISADEATAARKQAQGTYDATVKQLKGVEDGSKAVAASARSMGIQFVQGISGIATGQPVLTTLIQQGHTVVDTSLAMGTGVKGVGEAFKGMIAGIGGLPTLLGVALVGGMVALGASAESSARKLADMTQQLRATQTNYSALAGQVDTTARRIASSTTENVDDLRAAGQAIAGNKYYAGSAADMEKLLRLSSDLGRVWGSDVKSAAQVLAGAIEDPAKAAKDLAEKGFPGLTAEVVRAVDGFQKAGQGGQALSLLLTTLQRGAGGAAKDGMTPLQAATHKLGEALFGASDGGKSLAERLGGPIIMAAARVVDGIADAVKALDAALKSVGESKVWGVLAQAGAGATMVGNMLTTGSVGAQLGVRASQGSAAISASPDGAARAVDIAVGMQGQTGAQANSFLRDHGSQLDAARTAWCAAFVNSALAAVGIAGSGSNVATSFLNYGSAVSADAVAKGDILVQARGRAAGVPGGHVGMAMGPAEMRDGRQQIQMVSGNATGSGTVAVQWIDASEVSIRRAAAAAVQAAALPNASLPTSVSNQIYALAEQRGISPEMADLYRNMVARESGGRQMNDAGTAVRTSPRGALGVAGLMPGTAASLGVDPNDRDQNLLGGLRYLENLSRMPWVGSDPAKLAAAYNMGPGGPNAEKGLYAYLQGRIPLPEETRRYTMAVAGRTPEAGPAAAAVQLPEVTVTGTGIRNEQRAAADELDRMIAGTRALTAIDLANQLKAVRAAMAGIAPEARATSTAYAGLQQREADLVAAQYKNVDAMTEQQRAAASALRANEGLTEGERAYSAAIEQRRQVAVNAGLPFGDADKNQVALEFLSRQSQALGQLSAQSKEAIASANALSAAYTRGPQAVLDTTARLQAVQEARRLFPGQFAQQGAAVRVLTPIIQNTAQSAAAQQTSQANAQGRDNLEYIEAQTNSLGMNEQARNRLLAVMRAEQEMHLRFGSVLPAEAQEYVKLAGRVSDANYALQGQQAAMQELSGFGESLFSGLTSAASTTGDQTESMFKRVSNAATSAFQQIAQEAAKLAILNPLLNALFGGNRATLGGVGGLLGNLFNKDGSFSGAGGGVGGDPTAGFGATSAASSFETAGGSIASPAGFTLNALGGIYDSPDLSAFSGQVRDQPTFFRFAQGGGVFGEAGPEAIMPLRRGPDGKLGVSAGGGSDAASTDGLQVYLNIDARGSTPDAVLMLRTQLPGLIQQHLGEAMRRGGGFTKAVRGTR